MFGIRNSIESLNRFGLSDSEATVYLSLLENGPSSVMDLSSNISIKRSTTHNIVEDLIKLGLVTETFVGSKRKVVAEHPERLKSIIENKKYELRQLEDNAPQLINTLNKVIPREKDTTNVEIKYYKGITNVMSIYNESAKARDFRAYVNCEKLTHFFPGNVDKFLEAHSKRKDMNVREIMENSEASRAYARRMPKKRYFCKIVPEGFNLSVIDYMMFDGKVAIINLKENASGIMITNDDYYDNAKEIFDLVWSILPDYKFE